MNITSFLSRVKEAAGEAQMEVLVRESPASVIVTYSDAAEFSAKSVRDAELLAHAFARTDVSVESFDGGSWDKPDMPPFRLRIDFRGVDAVKDTNYGTA
jgi:hypothetical protein